MIIKNGKSLVCAVGFIGSVTFASMVAASETGSYEGGEKEHIAEVRSALGKVSKKLAGSVISKTPVEGIYEAQLEGSGILYVTADGQYAFRGDLYKLDNTRAVNLTNAVRQQKAISKLKDIDEKDVIAFNPTGETKRTMYVFTDVTCAYCQKLHDEVYALNAMGVSVKYLGFPRAGINSATYNNMVSAWCSDDQQAAYSSLISKKSIKGVRCDNPVASQLQLGQEMGVTGTPAIFLDDGTRIPGYKSASALAKIMGLDT